MTEVARRRAGVRESERGRGRGCERISFFLQFDVDSHEQGPSPWHRWQTAGDGDQRSGVRGAGQSAETSDGGWS